VEWTLIIQLHWVLGARFDSAVRSQREFREGYGRRASPTEPSELAPPSAFKRRDDLTSRKARPFMPAAISRNANSKNGITAIGKPPDFAGATN
jgi:hypothetical protein